MFRPVFSTVGRRHLTVSLVSVDPVDYDDSNNSASATLEIVAPTGLNQFNWRAQYDAVHNETGTVRSVSTTTDPLNNRDEVSYFEEDHHLDQATTLVYGELPEYLGRPLNFSGSTAMDGQPLVEVALDPLDDFLVDTDFSYTDPQYGIVTLHIECRSSNRTSPVVQEGQVVYASLAQLIVCTQGAEGDNIPPDVIRTQFAFVTNAGDVSYYSQHYATYTFGDGSDGYTYSFVGETNYTYGTLLFGNQWSFHMAISGPLGTRVANGSVPISSEDVAFVQPYECFDNSADGWSQHYCTEYSFHYVRLFGQAEGVAAGP
jgi:hypothetical protein